jgi:arylsulfatase A-like enzyme
VRLGLLALVVGIAGLVGACSRPQQAVLTRLIEDGESIENLDPRADFKLAAAWRRRLLSPADLNSWSFYVPAAPAALAGSGSGLDLEPLGTSQYLVYSDPLQAAGTDLLRFHFRQPLEQQAELYWNGAGEDFAPQRYVLQAPDPRDPHQVTFDLTGVDTWKGAITRIGLRLLDKPTDEQALLALEGLRYAAPPALGNGEARRVELQGRSMEALLARPESVLRRSLTVPPAARLRFHAAPWLPELGSVTIRVVALVSGSRRLLAEHVLRDRIEATPRYWSDFEVDLAPLEGQAIDLLFEVGSAPTSSMVAWGNPRVVGPAAQNQPNVILISLDTVRADHLSLYGYNRETTPHLSAWAERWGTVFETTVASAPWTLPSHVAMLSGIDAIHHGINRHGPIPPSMKLVPTSFSEAGYATFATTAGVLLTPQLGFASGFDDFRVRGKMESLPDWDSELSRGLTDTLSWLSSHPDERFFLFFHTFEAHAPYQPREPYFSRFGGSPKSLNGGAPVWMEAAGFDASVRPKHLLFHPADYVGGIAYPRRELQARDRALAATLYDSGLAHVDQELSRLWEYLERQDLMRDTIVVVTSDHGESLYEHGLVGHSSLYDHDLLVPLVIAAPLRSARGRRVNAQVRSVDIAPTLLRLAHLQPPDAIDGKSLLPFLQGENAAPRDAWSYALSTVRGVSLRLASRRLKVIAQDSVFDPFRGVVEVYDSSSDRGEVQDLALAHPAQSLREGLVRAVVGGSGSLEVQVSNAGPNELEGVLGGSAIDGKVTSGDLDFSCCEASEIGIRFRVPAGRGFTFRLQDRSATANLWLRLENTGRVFLGSFPLASIPSRTGVVWQAGEWKAESRAPPSGSWTGVEIRSSHPLERGRMDEAILLQGLRALGYVQ